jgi:hypothetical protein
VINALLAVMFLLQAPQRTVAIDERLAADAHIAVGDRVVVSAIPGAPFDGPITLRIGMTLHSIGPALAAQVMVEPLMVEPLIDLEAPAH